jgi:DNA-binding transcriptional regulator YiaG
MVESPTKPEKADQLKSSPRGRVALLGIARRTVFIKFEQKKRLLTHHKHLSLSIKTIGDWICSNRIKNNLAPCHLAAKMGITGALVRAWERGVSQPSEEQILGLTRIFKKAPPNGSVC